MNVNPKTAAAEDLGTHTGIAAPMRVDNIDTDQIIPSKEMKHVSKQGLSDGLFAGQRYLGSADLRKPNPNFILNQKPFDQASILLGGKNFGCGSSREHAVWAMHEFGFKAVIAESFGSIFRTNCLRNGLIPIVLKAKEIEHIVQFVNVKQANNKVSIDLHKRQVNLLDESGFDFELESHFREMLIQNLDFIALTLKHKKSIDDFIQHDKIARPWAYL